MEGLAQIGRKFWPVVFSLSLALMALAASDAPAATVKPLQDYGIARAVGAGGVQSAEGMSVDPISGKLVIADNWNRRVEIFSPAGDFLRAFGTNVDPAGGNGPEVCRRTCQVGADGEGAGELAEVTDVEVSPDGKLIYVSEWSNRRISVFTMRGQFRFAFGKNVVPGGGDGPEVCTDSCQAGTEADDAGSLGFAAALAFGADGDLYVANWRANRIERFSADGLPVAAYGRDVDKGGGNGGFEECLAEQCGVGADSGVGALVGPEGIDIDARGRLWVGSAAKDNVNVVTTAPSFEFSLGKDVIADQPGFGVCHADCVSGNAGDGPGELNSPRGIAVGARGTAYVADGFNERINAYRPSGKFRLAFGYDVAPGGAAGLEICTIVTGCQEGAVKNAFDVPSPVVVDCRGTIYTASSTNGIYARGGAAHRPGASAFGLSRKAHPGPCRLKLGKAKRNRKRGTAKLAALVPYAGKVVLNGKGIKRARTAHKGLEGRERLAVKPNRRLKRKLRRRGRARVKVTVKMRPSDGNVAQKRSKRITLKAKKKRKRR